MACFMLQRGQSIQENKMAEEHTTVEDNLANSIAMLEQILEVMPQDADALRAVYSAYRKVGQDERAFEYLSRIIDVYIGSDDKSLLPFIQAELDHFEVTNPSEVAAQHARLRTLNNSNATLDIHSEPPFSSDSVAPELTGKQEADISEEIALAWRLYEENQLSQEEYSSVLHDLTEVSSKELDVPVSVLHVLHDRGFTQMNRVINYMSSRSGVPCITLSGYEISEAVAAAIPVEISAHDGALPFAVLGDDLLVAVLNPFNHMLVDKVESLIGNRCRTFLVDPEDYDLALGRLRSLSDKAA
jgi:tetratricopeptide (TPR) repeat protein